MIKVALAGQPNCGKSTIFNLVSGINQHIANYPGVTVEKKSGKFSYNDIDIEMVDLPGTYSFSSFSLEERVAKDFIIDDKPDLIVNVVDASNLKRNLYLTFQLLEIGVPVVLVLNMMDVAQRRGISIDTAKISSMLGSSGAKVLGGDDIMQAIVENYNNKDKYSEFRINYEELEPHINAIESEIDTEINKRWVAIKLLEGDENIKNHIIDKNPNIDEIASTEVNKFHDTYDKDSVAFLATFRYDSADVIYHKAIKEESNKKETLTDKVDKIVLNRWLALPILLGIMYMIYTLSIVYGYKLTDYTWPILAMFKNFIIDFMPKPEFANVPMMTDFAIWMVNSANALLNYIPIFFILFALIAILEDTGYMPRMAFILDRLFRKFGLHGQSTLPLVLGGAFVGGCAVPGVMATKGIADDRARMATILAVPYMNCLAKVPFYTLILGAFFKPDMALMMFFISTITIFIALIVSKVLTSTILGTRETAPFVMELPPYHAPTFKGVIIRAWQRVSEYIKKVITIVLAVAVILFAMLQYPGLSEESVAKYAKQSEMALSQFDKKVNKNKYYQEVDTKAEVSQLLNYYDEYRAKRMITTSKDGALAVDSEFKERNASFFKFIKSKDKDAKKINRAIRKLSKSRKRILRSIKNEKIETSFLGMAGRALEPITHYAGFDWKINVSFLSSFAARESAVATLGSIYENNKADNQRAEEAMAQNSGYTPLHAVAIIIFMILTPPCIATMIVVKMQTNSYKWMLFAIFFPITLGIIASSTIFTLGSSLGLGGLEAMAYFYALVLVTAFIVGLYPSKSINFRGGYSSKVASIYTFNNKKDNN
jgi:ferrous iron transport protein B